MIINKLNQLYKPERTLYYMDADEEAIERFYSGNLDEVFVQCIDAYGTYDFPGIFYVDFLDHPVIGVEFRTSDPEVTYPQGLKTLTLNAGYYYSVEIDHEFNPDLDFIHDLFRKMAEDDDAHQLYVDLAITENPHAIGVFKKQSKLLLLYEWQVTSDRGAQVIADDFEHMDRDMLYKKAFFDPITGHYNWNHLVPFLEVPSDAGINEYAFIHFDVKEFRVINQVYGHIAANRVLTNIVDAMNEADFVYTSARCHNDNFAMLVKDMPKDVLIKKLEDFFEGLSNLEECPNYKVCYRCGVVLMKLAMLSGNRVADAAKLAQSMGTSHNKTDIVIYTAQMHEDILWSNYIKAYLDTAVAQDEFVTYLQPKFDIKTEKIKGAEALIRWNYKHRTLLPPYRFIPFFEKDGSIGKVDDIVLMNVCKAFSRWKKEGKPLYPISVNLSRSRLGDRNLVANLTGIVDSYGVDHALIDFELTESASYDNKEQMIRVIEGLRENGFRISMDDFGTGYSSLSLLTEMPFDTLKIDKSFVDKVGTEEDNEKDLILIRNIISLAKELEFKCLAEGAESENQVKKLREFGCETIQGYYYSKPIPLSEYEEKYL